MLPRSQYASLSIPICALRQRLLSLSFLLAPNKNVTRLGIGDAAKNKRSLGGERSYLIPTSREFGEPVSELTRCASGAMGGTCNIPHNLSV